VPTKRLLRHQPNRVQDGWQIKEKTEYDINQQILAGAFLQKNRQWRQNDC
jgi:hypothetical protein